MKNNIISENGRGYGKTVAQYSQLIESGNYPSNVNSFHQNELSKMWKDGKRMEAIKYLQDIIEPARSGKTLL